MIKKYFLTGLAILLPIFVTLFLVAFTFNLLSKPLQGIMFSLLNYYGLTEKISAFQSDQILTIVSKTLSFLILMATILLAGIAARLFFMRTILRFGDYIIRSIPIVNKVYKASQEVVKTLFGSKTNNFSQVVLVPFPHARALSIGFLTNENSSISSAERIEDRVSVFVPGTPNPTIGFMLTFKKSEIQFIEMTVEEALKFIVSFGVAVEPKFSSIFLTHNIQTNNSSSSLI
ncbi:DUF502 domain-containing protein [Parachlamydia sp. AcF125]|uniref:DUF502 domain-containing protein n=1 Tax=Parachlamydia sp. AcF125 TaxID=2795736 RepID=UPI001BC8CB2C|nr:DUF502 domain-containing protein [Parachlamydia sp. AcF125]MBS4169162.1 hypothetical protein [Parachlamydia sp. AcF125]